MRCPPSGSRRSRARSAEGRSRARQLTVRAPERQPAAGPAPSQERVLRGRRLRRRASVLLGASVGCDAPSPLCEDGRSGGDWFVKAANHWDEKRGRRQNLARPSRRSPEGGQDPRVRGISAGPSGRHRKAPKRGSPTRSQAYRERGWKRRDSSRRRSWTMRRSTTWCARTARRSSATRGASVLHRRTPRRSRRPRCCARTSIRRSPAMSRSGEPGCRP